MTLFDTDILIDYLRSFPEALSFVEKFSDSERALSLITALELLQGCKGKKEQFLVERFLQHFKIFPLDAALSKQAYELYREYRWQYAMDIPDVFIAATVLQNGIPLVTRNIKHFEGLPKLAVQKPY